MDSALRRIRRNRVHRGGRSFRSIRMNQPHRAVPRDGVGTALARRVERAGVMESLFGFVAIQGKSRGVGRVITQWARILQTRGVGFATIGLCALCLVFSPFAKAAAAATIAWDPINSPIVTGYRIYYGPVGTSFLGSVDVGNTFTGQVAGLQEGITYRFAVVSYGVIGVESALSSEVTYTPRLAPTVQLSQPIAGSVVASGSTVLLAADVVSNGNAIGKVEFLVDGAVVGEDLVAPYTLSWTATSEGQHTVASRVSYSGSSTVNSGAVSLSVTTAPTVVASTPPLVILTSPVDGSVRSTPLSIGMAASVQANGHVISKVQFYSGSRLIGEDTTSPYSCTWPGVTAGTYSVFARAIYDGNLIQVSSSSVVIVQDLPVIELTAPLNGTVWFSPATIGLVASVTANNHVISKVRFFNGTTLLGEDTTAPYTWQWSGVGDGVYSITARVYYDSGSSLPSAPVSLTVTSTPPTIRIDSPVSGSIQSFGSDVLIHGVVAMNGHAPTKVQFLRNGEWMGEVAGPDYQWQWTAASAGQHVWVARLIYDGGVSLDSAPVTITVALPPPSIQLTSPLNDSSYLAGTDVSLQAAVQANGNPVIKVEFLVDDVVVGESNGPLYGANWSSAAARTYRVAARLTYGSGLVSSSVSNLVTLTNPPPSVRLDFPLAGTAYQVGEWIPIQASLTLKGNTPSKVQYLVNGQVIGETTTSGLSLNWAGSVPGSYSLVARLFYNGLRTVDSLPVGISLASTPPVIALEPALDGAAFAPLSTIPLGVVIQANGNPINSVEYIVDGVSIATVTEAPYTWLWTNAPVGAHLLTARLSYSSSATLVSAPASFWVGELPPPWLSKDFQTDGWAGSSSRSNQVFAISGAGVVNGAADSARFVYQALSGDAEITACILSTTPTGRAGSVGLMMRESLAADSRHVFMGIAATGEWRWQRRDDTAGITWTGNYGVSSLPRAWVRLVRVGNLFSGYSSSDGVNWTLQNTRTLLMPSTIYFGLVVSSGASTSLNAAEFGSVLAVP